MSRVLLLALAILLACAAMPVTALSLPADTISSAPLNINKFKIWALHDGRVGRRFGYPLTFEPFALNGTYPLRTTTVLWTSSLLWGGYVHDGFEDGEIRATGAYYNSGLVRGAILAPGYGQNPTAPAVRVYRVRHDFATADLRVDAADVFMKPADQVTDAEIGQLRAQYTKDWEEWPWWFGAPFYDLNGNRTRDPGEDPGLAGADQVIWFATNDLDPIAAAQLYLTPPTGVEIQTTLWGYKSDRHVLANSVFERNRLIYKGTLQSLPDAHIDSVYITRFADTDLGNSGDDLLGSDSVLQMGYTYNGYSVDLELNAKGTRFPPAVGYTLLQGPLVPGEATDEAIFDFRKRLGYRNLPATSMMAKYSGTPWQDPPYSREGGKRLYRWMKGFLPDPSNAPLSPFRNPDGTPTKWSFPADPRLGKGAADGLNNTFWSTFPGDRRFLLSTGPFKMALGDTQEVVYALVGADGGDRLGNTYYLKWFTKFLQQYYPDLKGLRAFAETLPAEETPVPPEFRLDQNYPNPFNPGTTIHFQLPSAGEARLEVFDMLGRPVSTLVNGWKEAGTYDVQFDGSQLASGLYVYRLQAGHYIQSRRLVILR